MKCSPHSLEIKFMAQGKVRSKGQCGGGGGAKPPQLESRPRECAAEDSSLYITGILELGALVLSMSPMVGPAPPKGVSKKFREIGAN